MLERRQLPFVLAGVFLMTLQPVLVTLSQDDNGKIQYSAISSTLLTELLKLGISSCLYWRYPSPPNSQPSFEIKKLLEYSIPALIYFINNNLVFAILQLINATTFQLLSQLKTVFTGLLFRFFLSRKLTYFQYLAIWQLACGTAMSQLPTQTGDVVAGQSQGNSSFGGLALSIISCNLSAFGGIYSEKLLKNQPKESIHWQNIQLYGWGIFFNIVGILLHDSDVIMDSGFFANYNRWAFAVVINNALNGLAISAILKYADNIARVYAHASAMLVTMVLSIFLFGQNPTPQLLIAIAVVSASAVQYNLKPEHVFDDARNARIQEIKVVTPKEEEPMPEVQDTPLDKDEEDEVMLMRTSPSPRKE